MTAKKAFITGGSEGLGRTYALKLASEGWQITVAARNEERLKQLVNELGNDDGHDYIVADLAIESGIQACASRLHEQAYDLMINNAGYSRFGDYHAQDINDELKILQVNCGALMTLSHAYLANARKGDALINLSSITAWLPTPVQATYVASKAFIKSFSENLWYQQAKRGIYVQALCPGTTKTEFMNRAGEVSRQKLLDMISGSPEAVIDASYNALLKRKQPIVIPGYSNVFMALMMNLTPRRVSIWLMGKVSDFGFQ